MSRTLSVCFLAGALTGAVSAADSPELTTGATRAGVGRYAPESWGEVETRVRNPGAAAEELLVLHAFGGRDNVQFGGRVWLPPESRRRLTLPVRPPEPDRSLRGQKTPSFALETLLVREGNGGPEQQLGRKSGLLPAVRRRPVTAVVSGGGDAVPTEVAVGLRKAKGLGPAMGYLGGQSLPKVTAGYEALDCLIVASDGEDVSDAQRLALRQWVLSGGRLWIMAERTSPELARDLLGPDWSLHRVGRTSLNDVAIEGGGSSHETTASDPIPFVRVAHSGMRVRHRTRGWPASLTKSVGRGRLLVTTVGGRAWLEEDGAATPVLRDLRDFFSESAGPAPIPAEQLEPYAAKWIGHEALARRPVAAVLGLYCAALLVAGAFLMRKRRLEHMGWLGAAAAVGAAIGIAALGTLHRRRVPLTFATGQIASIQPSQQHAVIGGVMGIYSPRARRGVVRASRGGIVWSDVAHSRSGAPLRTIWTDIDRWHWENFDLPSGALVTAGFRQSSWLERPVSCRIRLGADRVTVRFRPGPLRGLRDPLLAAPRGTLPLEKAGTEQSGSGRLHRFAGSPDRRLPRGQYIDAGVLSGRQRLHQQLYSAALSQSDYPSGLTLMVWARPMDLGLTLPSEAVRRDRAMIAVDAKLERPEPGERVVVPAALVESRPLLDRGATITAYNPMTGEWIEQVRQPMRIPLAFTLPENLGPIRVDRLELEMRMDASAWRVAARPLGGGAALATAEGPRGETTLRFDAGAGLQPDEAGRVSLALHIEPRGEPDRRATWTLHRVGLSVHGVAGAEEKGAEP